MLLTIPKPEDFLYLSGSFVPTAEVCVIPRRAFIHLFFMVTLEDPDIFLSREFLSCGPEQAADVGTVIPLSVLSSVLPGFSGLICPQKRYQQC